MVKVTGYQQRKTAEGKTFLVLELEGGLQIQTSQNSGNPYASISKCTIPCTFEEDVAKQLVGTTLPGTIVKEPCEPYDFLNPQTEEILTLEYRHCYKAPETLVEKQAPTPQLIIADVE